MFVPMGLFAIDHSERCLCVCVCVCVREGINFYACGMYMKVIQMR